MQWDEQQVRLLDPRTGELLREHRREGRGRHRIHPDDKPKQTPLGTQQLPHRARQTGERIGSFCHSLHQQNGQTAVRHIQGLFALAKKHGVAVVDDACGMALETGMIDFRFLRRYLERATPFPLALRHVDPLIRGLEQYRDAIAARSISHLSGEPSE